jgi:polar amino acid transport system substrate-binding protein
LVFNRRFSEATQFVKQKINSKSSKTPYLLDLVFPPLDKDHWTNIKEIGGGRVVGEAIHAIDLACYLFDSLPQSISFVLHQLIRKNNEVNEKPSVLLM